MQILVGTIQNSTCCGSADQKEGGLAGRALLKAGGGPRAVGGCCCAAHPTDDHGGATVIVYPFGGHGSMACGQCRCLGWPSTGCCMGACCCAVWAAARGLCVLVPSCAVCSSSVAAGWQRLVWCGQADGEGGQVVGLNPFEARLCSPLCVRVWGCRSPRPAAAVWQWCVAGQ